MKKRGEGGLGEPQGTGCVADSEYLGESTGSTGQVWSTNFGTQPLTISCGFPAPYLAISPRGPSAFDAQGSAPVPIAEGSANHGARGCSLESDVTSVTGVINKYKYIISKSLYDCYIVWSSNLREVLQELRVLHVTSSRNDRYRPKLEVGLRQQWANSGQ